MTTYTISSSLTSKLEQIKQYMSKNSVTAFIGSGFSLNAEMPSHVQMKTWVELRDDFLAKLYGKNEEAKRNDHNDVIQLASLIDAEFKRNELDDILEAALPDKLIRPGILHRKLVKLPWRDILTTNYDTLIERAAEEEVQKYQLVTNKETLLYQPSPRIIKLHGSFPNIRPYIMTKEDFRRYPLEHPEMVNTARQAFLESLICLIGFSGDDPNFLSWLGWLRDVIGKDRICPTYLVTYKQGFHDAEKSLMAQLGIDIINLAEIPELNDFKKAYDFFLDYLASPDSSQEWSGRISSYDYRMIEGEEEKGIENLVEEMHRIRKTYPGWIVLPTKCYDQFRDASENILFLGKQIDRLADNWNLKLRLLYEFDWRLSISCTPKDVEWYIPKINEIIEHIDSPNFDQMVMINELHLSLLQIYRLKHKPKEFGQLCQLLLADSVNIPIGYIKYQQVLFSPNSLDYKSIQQYLSEWSTDYGDYLDCIHKASVLIMMSNQKDAFEILDKCRLMLSQSWVHQGNDAYNSSCLVYVLELLGYCRTNNNVSYIPKHLRQGFTLDDQNAYCCKQAYEKHPERGKRITHNFKLGSYSNTWSMGASGFVVDYLYPQRWFAMKEKVGMAFCMVDEKFYQYCIDRMFAYDWRFAWDKLLVVAYSPFVKETLTRRCLSFINRVEANEYFDEYIGYLDMYDVVLNVRQKGVIQYNLVLMLGRLCSKVSDDRIVRYVKSLMKFDVHTINEILDFIYDFLPKDKLSLVMPTILANCKISTSYEQGVHLPSNRTNLSFSVDSSLLTRICEGFLSDDGIRQNESYQLCLFLWNNKKMAKEDREQLECAVRKWRARNESVDIHDSFNLLDANEDEIPRLKTLVQKAVDDFCQGDYIYKGSSAPLSLCALNLEKVCIHNHRLTEVQIQKVFNCIIDVIHHNIEVFSKTNDNDMFFGGLKTFMDEIILYVSNFVCQHISDIIGNDYLSVFSTDLETILDKGYRCLPMLVWLTSYRDTQLMTEEMIERLKRSIFSKESSMRIQTVFAILFAWDLHNDICDILNHIFSVLKVIIDVRIVDSLILIEKLMLKGFDSDLWFSSKVAGLLAYIHDKIKDFELDADEKIEVCYHVNLVAGVASVIYKNEKFPTKLDFPYFNLDESGFNDVALGFERGIEEATDLEK